MNQNVNFRSRLTEKLPVFVFCLFVLQPVMDVLSFWVTRLELSNAPTLLLRFGVLGVTVLLGFGLSHRKRVYWIAAGVMALIGVGHILAASQVGYQDIIGDLTNYVRCLQMPLTALCMITFLRENEDCYRAMKWGIWVCLLIIFAVQLLAIATGTEPHTYLDMEDGRGYIGWFSNTNSQSAILSMLAPVTAAWLYTKKGLKSPLFWFTFLASLAAMYFLGPRLSFLGLAATGFGLGLSLILIGLKNWKQACAFCAASLVFVALMPVSPMMAHQKVFEDFQDERQGYINAGLAQRAPELLEDDQDDRVYPREYWIQALTPVYEFYAPDFVELFGAERTIEIYEFSWDVRQITATRQRKLQFARLLMAESPALTHAFGIELSRFTINNHTYDVENDLHGIYYLYGIVGLGAMLAFLGYFLYLIVWALIKDAKTYFTLDAAAWGIALVMCLLHVYCTAGVLRRPNASFYLSITLAAIYYLVRIKKYEKPQTLPER